MKFIIWNSIVWILKFEFGFRFRFKMNKIYFLIIIFLNKIILKIWFLSLLFHLHFLSFCLSSANPHNTIHQNSATFFYHHQNYPQKKKKKPTSQSYRHPALWKARRTWCSRSAAGTCQHSGIAAPNDVVCLNLF